MADEEEVGAVLDEFNFGDGVVNAADVDARRMATEIADLRDVLVFADGAILANNQRWGEYEFVLADLYNETTPLQGVIARAGCHERRKFVDSATSHFAVTDQLAPDQSRPLRPE